MHVQQRHVQRGEVVAQQRGCIFYPQQPLALALPQQLEQVPALRAVREDGRIDQAGPDPAPPRALA